MKARGPSRSTVHRSRGMTLVELMISMVLGLVVIGSVISVLVANKQSYRTNEALAQVQESARTAFELLARDVQQAGSTGCDNTGRIANVLNPGTEWWQTWFGITGYDAAQADPAVPVGTGDEERVNGTDSLQLQGVEGNGLSVEDHDPASPHFKINAATTSFNVDDILMVCDFDHAAIFQVSSYDSANVTVVHDVVTGTPANCSTGLGYPTQCTPFGNVYEFGANSRIARVAAVDWYIGNNGRSTEGGRSLYRQRLSEGTGVESEEIVAGVSNMQIRYRLDNGNDFVDAASMAPGDWANVNAALVTLTIWSADQNVSTSTSVNSGRIQRSFTNLITLRNRVP